MGVKIDSSKKPELTARVVDFLNSASTKKIFTPNPEMLVMAQRDNNFKDTLNSADLNLCDGFGLKLVSGGKLTRWPGSDFVHFLCSSAQEHKKGIYFLGTGGIVGLKKATEELRKIYPTLRISGFDVGQQITVENGMIKLDEFKNRITLDKINSSGAEILVVAFGQKKQECWINENITKLTGVRIAIGVGGAIDYISGVSRRAPKWMRCIGMEWFYRLIREPKRLKRIYNATFVFLYYFLKDKYAGK